MRAEPSLSQHRQKPWVSMAEIFEDDDSISHADGELSGPVYLVLSRGAGFKLEMPNIQSSCMAFFGRKGHQKRGEKTWKIRDFSLVRCNLKEPRIWTF